jgi:hypothetical protein
MLYDPKWEAPAETKSLERWRTTLLAAADYIEAYSLYKGSLRDYSSRRMCTVGALAEVCSWEPRLAQEACHRLFCFLGDSVLSIVAWNDALERTTEEVVSAMRACANADK